MGLFSSLWAACTGASAQWTRQKQTPHQLDAVATVSLPQKFIADGYEPERTPDRADYRFRRVNDTHINGQTSYAEDLTITVVAPDLPPARFDRMLRIGEIAGMGRTPGLGEPDAEARRWLVRETVYEQHPVTEPSWLVRVDDAKRGIVLTWRGFKKQYTLEEAKLNLTTLIAAVSLSPAIADEFAKRRSWARSGWEPAYAVNSGVAAAVLNEFKLTLPASDSMTRNGRWRIYLDDERPQQLHVVHELAALTLPDGPFRITEPVTYYKYMQQRWIQDNQGELSDRLPANGQLLMAPEFTDTAKVYFYQMKAVDMWRTYTSENDFAEMLRSMLKSVQSTHTKLLRDGFIAGDAAP